MVIRDKASATGDENSRNGPRENWHERCTASRFMFDCTKLLLAVVAALSIGCGLTRQGKAPTRLVKAPPRLAATAQQGTIDAHVFGAKLDAFTESRAAVFGPTEAFTGFVLVANRKRVIYERAWGFADREQSRRADRDTTFHIGSITKQFTAAAILLLQDQGKLSVTDTVGKYLPDYPAVGRDITIRQLLTHTSGVADYLADERYSNHIDQFKDPYQVIKLFASKPLDFQPGSKFAYSNSGYVLLGAIIEAVSGQTYHDYMRDHIFGPAGLSHTAYTGADVRDESPRNRAIGYAIDKGRVIPTAWKSEFYSAGGVRSSASDLLRWNESIEKLLSPDALAQMYALAPNVAASKLVKPKVRAWLCDGYEYGFGWWIYLRNGHRTIGHGGFVPGFESWYLRLLDEGYTVIALSNNDGIDSDEIAGAAAALLENIPVGSFADFGSNPNQSPTALPARIEAEDFVRFSDTTADHFGDCGHGPVDQQVTQDVDGECNIGWTEPGEWLEYPIRGVGRYELALRIASEKDGKRVEAFVDGRSLGVVDTVGTGWQSWVTRTLPVTLDAGPHTLRVQFLDGWTNLNWLSFSKNEPSSKGAVLVGDP